MGEKIYMGIKTSRGHEVFVSDGETKKDLFHIVFHSPLGFSWGYNGSGPADLALSILADYFNEHPTRDELVKGRFAIPEAEFERKDFNENVYEILQKHELKCWLHHQAFKMDFIKGFEKAGFILPSSLIRAWLQSTERLNHG